MNTRLARPSPSALRFSERVALFVASLHRDAALALLEGFAERHRPRAEAYATKVLGMDSARRQALLTHEFGSKPEAAARVSALVVECQGPALRAAVVARLPLSQRAQFPQCAGGGESASPAARALAARLVREATR